MEEACLRAIRADSLNQGRLLSEPLLFRESSLPTNLRENLLSLYPRRPLYHFMKEKHSVHFYGVLLTSTGEIVRGSYWSELLEDEEEVYTLS